MIRDIKAINIPQYATFTSATASFADMGDKTISIQSKIDGSIVPDFSYDWEIEFKGERYIQPLRKPQASKGNESINSVIDLVFYHKTIYELKRNYFVELASVQSGVAIADKYIASLSLDLGEFCVVLQNVLFYYYGNTYIVDLNPDFEYSKEKVFVNISYSYIWDVIQSIHPNYGVRWYLNGNTFYVGYPANEITHIFEYGYKGGLAKIERQVQDSNIRNRILGRGGERNLPAYYFKEAPEGSSFTSDPDAIPELANVYFSELRGKTFRDYVKGWKAKHYNGTPMDNPTEAYNKGFTDTKFSPIEYVDNQSSIDQYGILIGALENIEDVYPSIQGVTIEPYGRIDEVVAVSEVTSDDVEQSANDNVVVSNISSVSKTQRNIQIAAEFTITQRSTETFTVPDGSVGTIDGVATQSAMYYIQDGVIHNDVNGVSIQVISSKIHVYDTNTNKEVSSVNIPSGTYSYTYEFKGKNIIGVKLESATVSFTNVKLITSQEDKNAWKPTFDIWVKNLWSTSKLAGESDTDYANRVWTPILGAKGNEATINFGTGWLAASDYDFVIAKGGVAYDTSKSFNGVNSEWRITLYKTDAELEATGKYLPNATTNGNAKAGDYFYFTNIDLPHQYVLWAEEMVDERKLAESELTSKVNPTWVVNFDKIRLNTLEEGEANTLLSQLSVGSIMNASDFRFMSGVSQLYISSITYSYGESLFPNVEVVLSDKVIVSTSPIQRIQGEIDGVYKQLGVLATASSAEVAVGDIVRKIGSKLFLHKDGQSDLSLSPTTFSNLVSSDGFIQGLVGGAGWGIYKDDNGNTVIEADKINARQELQANSFVSHQVSIIGGEVVISAADMECSGVEYVDAGYKCYFAQRSGSIVNRFALNDIAYSQVYDPNGSTIVKYYKCVVVEVGSDFIVLSDTMKDGNGIPSKGDVIAHFGNTTNKDRQGIIVISSYGSENPRISQYSGVDSFSLVGKEQTRIQPDNNLFTGKMVLQAGSSGLKELEEWKDLQFGGSNMLRNSGFTGDYLSRSIEDESVLDAVSEMDNPKDAYWTSSGSITVQEETHSISRYCANVTQDLRQVLQDTKLVKGESYTISFNVKGKLSNFQLGNKYGKGYSSLVKDNEYTFFHETITITEDVSDTYQAILFVGESFTIFGIKLEAGNVPSVWSPSTYDNASSEARYKSLEYLNNTLQKGKTEINGGLLLGNVIELGNVGDTDTTSHNAGISGINNINNDVAFWGGGTLRQAINGVNLYEEKGATYQPSEEELKDMAKFIVTHGGRAILEDAIVRGTIYAESGVFNGEVNANAGKFENIEATNSKFTGEVNAESGRFGGLYLRDGILQNLDEFFGINVYEYKNGSAFIKVGISPSNGITAYGGFSAIASDEKPAIQSNGVCNFVTGDNEWIRIHGMTNKCRSIAQTTALKANDDYIIARYDNITITLPNLQEIWGEMGDSCKIITIHNASSGAIYIRLSESQTTTLSLAGGKTQKFLSMGGDEWYLL